MDAAREAALEVLAETDFPEELALNADPDNIRIISVRSPLQNRPEGHKIERKTGICRPMCLIDQIGSAQSADG